MSKRKVTIAALVAALVLLIGGMIAYFTDEESTDNVFELGNVNITLTEPSWNATVANNMTPGKTVDKDPTVTNDGTNPAYVFVEVKVPMTDETTPKPVFTYELNSGWVEVGTPSPSGGFTTHVYAYGTSTAMTTLAVGASTPAVFDEVTLNSEIEDPSTISLDSSDQFKLNVKAKAIQSNDLGETAPDAVYALF